MYLEQEPPGLADQLEMLAREFDAAVTERKAVEERHGETARGSFQEGVDRDMWQTMDHPYEPFANTHPEYAAAQAKVLEVADRRDAANRTYFRLNIWGMGRYREVMATLGMAVWEYEGGGYESPDPEAFGLDPEVDVATHVYVDGGGQPASYTEPIWHLEDGSDEFLALPEDKQTRVRLYKEAGKRMLGWRPEGQPGIPLHKFGSNDGWWVTPDECREALQAFGEFIAPAYNGTFESSLDQVLRREGGQGTVRSVVAWTEALDAFRAADETERGIMLAAALMVREVPATIEGPAWKREMFDDYEDTDIVKTCQQPYWLQWLRFLEDGSQLGGFRVH